MAKGLDFAFKPHPSVQAIKAYGAEWVGRYVSANPANDTNGKNLLPAEHAELAAAGLKIVLFAEEGAAAMKAGRSAGVAHARHAVAVTKALRMDGIPIYYCADWDATPADQAAINAYLDGAISVHGKGRTGIYGGYYVVKRVLDAGKAAFSCQTRAWSGGQWDPRVNIRQGPTVTVGGADCDADEARTADYGQWPRPADPPPAGPYRHTAPGDRSLAQIAAARNTTPAHLTQVTAAAMTPADVTVNAGLPLPAGWVFYTTNP